MLFKNKKKKKKKYYLFIIKYKNIIHIVVFDL